MDFLDFVGAGIWKRQSIVHINADCRQKYFSLLFRQVIIISLQSWRVVDISFVGGPRSILWVFLSRKPATGITYYFMWLHTGQWSAKIRNISWIQPRDSLEKKLQRSEKYRAYSMVPFLWKFCFHMKNQYVQNNSKWTSLLYRVNFCIDFKNNIRYEHKFVSLDLCSFCVWKKLKIL